ncbi:MAG: MBL fold metallo-hydrolase [Ignavibacteriales bacterium]|nr:MBL fold metallo-hydrolase [Ignavibacteriales bacterium]
MIIIRSIILALFLLYVTSYSQEEKPIIKIHYIGHSSFIMQFDDDISVLTDYGTSNAWGLDSPIYDINDFQPTIVTYSHTHHIDHFDSARVPNAQYIFKEPNTLELDGLEITPIQTCEKELGANDVTSYLFEYKGLKILHLADAQAYITNIYEDSVRQKVKELYPERVDLLFMTIGFYKDISKSAEEFLYFLKPQNAILMHYWSKDEKDNFLNIIDSQKVNNHREYEIIKIDDSKYFLFENDKNKENLEIIKVISLEPKPFTEIKQEVNNDE